MPYFGIWNSINETDTTINRFQSTSAYQIVPELSSEYKIILKKRNDWFSVTEKSIDLIEFKFLSEEEIINSEYTILERTNANPFNFKQGYNVVHGPPTILNALILSPYKEGFFKNLINRQVFSNKFKLLQEQAVFNKSKYFYLSATSHVIANNIKDFSSDLNGIEIDFAFPYPTMSSSSGKETIEFIKKIFEGTGAIINFKFGEPMKDRWRQRLLSNEEFDARLNNVDIGGHIQNPLLKMVFCSKLGVSYPDPSGRICNLVKKQDLLGGAIAEDYISEFNQILTDDAVVIPLMHYGTTWELSEKIDPETFPPTVVSPSFESIYFK